MQFLSPAWIDALDRAARQHRGSPGPDATGVVIEPGVVIEHRVTGTAGGEVRYCLTVRPDGLEVHAGAAGSGQPASDLPVVTLTSDEHTARAIASHQQAPQRAFLTGRLRLGGDIAALLANRRALAALGDLFAEVRHTTRW